MFLARSWAHGWRPFCLPAGILLLWFVATRKGWIPLYLLPSPADVLKAARAYLLGGVDDMYAGRFWQDVRVSGMRVGAGFFIAAASGVPLGLATGRSEPLAAFLDGLIHAVRAVPGITWLPLAIVWLGVGTKTTVFLVALAAFFPVYLNSAAGARQVPPLLLRASDMMGISRWKRGFLVILPASMPAVVSGLRLGLGISWAYLVLGELTGVPDGLGAFIMDARMFGRVDMIIVGMLCIAAVGRGSERILLFALKRGSKAVRRMEE